MRVYLSGPMTGVPDNNRPAFEEAAKLLRKQGHFVINPHDFTPLFGSDEEISDSFEALYWEASYGRPHALHSSILANSIMSADLAAVRSCDAIYLLRGWETSRGAKRELAEAIAHGLTIMQEGDEK